ncbi:MAG: hypothetical protein LM580_05460 [Thermofilum sp.]|nr:hypothetical protein [Thermofilum sp.]
MVPVPVDRGLYVAPDEETAREVEEWLKRRGLMGPFLKGLYSAAVKQGEGALEVLMERGEKLPPEERERLWRMVVQGLEAKRRLEEYLEWEKRMRAKGVRFYWERGEEKRGAEEAAERRGAEKPRAAPRIFCTPSERRWLLHRSAPRRPPSPLRRRNPR